jgi:trans-2,3-dihydro-3-hydroxyanthranilate isomerase
MESLMFYILDVFAEEKYAGNQLAVVRDAGGLSDSQMQKIAREMNYSETTFILSEKPRDGGYDVRIFTPEIEVPFAGHPTLGTAFVIQQEIVGKQIEALKLNMKVGQIPVTFNYDGEKPGILWMKQITPIFGDTVESGAISAVLGIDESDIDGRFPIQEVSTGIPFIIVPLKSLAAVKRAKIVRDKYFRLIEDREAKAVFIFCPETYHPANDIHARMFADYYGVPEDPATGSANGCLAGYLVKYRYSGNNKIDVRVEQGYEIGRASLLYLRAEEKGGVIDVTVGGRVVMVAKGELV